VDVGEVKVGDYFISTVNRPNEGSSHDIGFYRKKGNMYKIVDVVGDKIYYNMEKSRGTIWGNDYDTMIFIKKVKDTKLARKVSKVYKEEGDYIWVRLD
jgi:hypothetical protein